MEYRGRLNVIRIALLLWSCAAIVRAENSQLEFGGNWLLDPVAQNWSCQVAPGKAAPAQCRNYPPAYNAFISAEPVVVKKSSGVQKYYFYVGTWGQLAGPTNECVGDGIGIFEAPYTAAGALGQVNLIYRGSARPCDGAYWYISSAFYDASLKEVYVTGERTDFNTNTIFKELWLLRSPDIGTTQDGLNFTQSLVLRSGLADLNLHGLHVKPHPTTPKLWWGYLFYDNTSDEVWHATAQVYVDWNNNTVRYRTSATGWTTVPIGGTMAVMPYRALTRPVVSFSNVGGRWEAWASGNDQTELPARNGVPPCAPPLTLYNQNVSGPFAQDGSTRSPSGNDLRYYTADADLSLLNSRAIYSQLRPVPSDYQFELVNAKRIDTLAGHVLYSGSLRRTICTYDLLDYPFFWSGSGIWAGQVRDQ